jgi:cyclic pyranopterin phosphate synthase
MILDKRQRPLRDLRISVTDKCNYRCTYCMPADVFGESYRFLIKDEVLTFAEIERTARLFVQLGVTKIRLTGGEPLIRPNIETLISRLAAIPGVEDLALTTNGTFLAEKAHTLKQAGLHRLTISLDSLDEEIYAVMNGRRGTVQQVLAGIHQAEAAGFHPIKLNCVVKRGINDHTIVELARHFKGTGHIVRYIEYMDAGSMNGWRMDDVVPASEIIQKIDAVMPLEPIAPNYTGEVARRYRYADGGGEIGVVTSVSRPFCGDCSRIRVTAAGELYTCLFGEQRLDLRQLLRTETDDAVLRQKLTQIWHFRDDRYSEIRTADTNRPARRAEMVRIGG